MPKTLPSRQPSEQEQQPQKHNSIFHILILGIQTIISEWHWLIIQGLRRLEQNQIQARLDREHSLLAQLEKKDSTKTSVNPEEIDLCRQQIQFLDLEMARLRDELDKTRQEYIAKRCEAWGLIRRP